MVSERKKELEWVTLPDISCIWMMDWMKSLGFMNQNRQLCILYHAKRLILGLKVE